MTMKLPRDASVRHSLPSTLVKLVQCLPHIKLTLMMLPSSTRTPGSGPSTLLQFSTRSSPSLETVAQKLLSTLPPDLGNVQGTLPVGTKGSVSASLCEGVSSLALSCRCTVYPDTLLMWMPFAGLGSRCQRRTDQALPASSRGHFPCKASRADWLADA